VRRPLLLALLTSQALACNDDVTIAEGQADDEASGTSETSSGSSSESGMGASETDSASTRESTSETGTPAPFCGDGVLDLDEECDDGNAIDDDGCSSACESACGSQGWLDLTLRDDEPGAWFAVHRMIAHGPDELLALGELQIAGKPGRIRVVEVADDQILGSLDGAPLGPLGTPELPQTHRIDALARSGDGTRIVALGTSSVVLVADEPALISHWLASFDATTLTELWRVEIPTSDEDLRPLDVGALAGGDAVLARTSELAPNERDIAFERRSALDGSVVWTSSYSGPLEAGYSLDRALQVAVAPDERVFGSGIVRKDWQTYETTLLELDVQTGEVVWTAVPLPDSGNLHEQLLGSLAAGPGGVVAIGIDVLGPSQATSYGAAFAYVEHELAWSLRRDDLPWTLGDPYVNPRVAVDDDGEVLVAGRYTHDFGGSTAPRAWVVALAPDGTQRCAAWVGEGNLAALVPALGFFGGGRGAINLDTFGQGGMGPMSGGNWIARLRGW
jgi:cysteine-rich repeat protein